MTITQADINTLWTDLCARVAGGDRFAGLFATGPQDGTLVVSADVATAGGIDTLDAPLPRGAAGYPALTRAWARRSGTSGRSTTTSAWSPRAHPRLASLIRPGSPEDHALPGTWRATGSSRSHTARLRRLLGRFRVDGVPGRYRARRSRT